MPTVHIPRSALPEPEALAPGVAGSSRGAISVQAIDGSGGQLGPEVAVAEPAAFVAEGHGDGLTPAWGLAEEPLSVELDLPEGAAALSLRAGPSAPVLLPLHGLGASNPRAPDAVRSFGQAASWRLAVVGERFSDGERFFRHCESLHNFISGERPFSDEGVSFGIDALFWSSDPMSGLFGAADANISGRVLSGNNDLVNALVRSAGFRPRKILVIIDSPLRAGAGGSGGERPSWTTVAADPPERWEAVALHELGHAFGLADEYDTRFDLEEPDPLEPNVSSEADPTRVSWSRLCTVGAPPAPTALRGQEFEHGAETVGTFQGARYRPEDRFRPSRNCRMRTTTAEFCAVCRAHVKTVLQRG